MGIINIVISIATVLLVGLLIYVIVVTFNKYDCTEGNCERKMNGVYSSKKACQQKCSGDADDDSEEDEEDEEDEELEAEDFEFGGTIDLPVTYNCIKNKQGFFHCEEDKEGDGDYNSLEDCQSNCYNEIVRYPVYYPIRNRPYWGGYYRRRPYRRWNRPRRYSRPRRSGPSRGSGGRRTTTRSRGPRPFRSR